MSPKKKEFDQLSRVVDGALYHQFVKKIRLMLAACNERHVIYVATSGNRTYDEQDELFAKGRTKLGGIVTKARGGQSNHNFGIAMDFARDAEVTGPKGEYDGLLQPKWDEYNTLAEEARRVGLEWGGAWTSIVDKPHVQLPIGRHGITVKQLDRVYRAGGYVEVFKYLDQFQW